MWYIFSNKRSCLRIVSWQTYISFLVLSKLCALVCQSYLFNKSSVASCIGNTLNWQRENLNKTITDKTIMRQTERWKQAVFSSESASLQKILICFYRNDNYSLQLYLFLEAKITTCHKSSLPPCHKMNLSLNSQKKKTLKGKVSCFSRLPRSPSN